MHLLLTDRLTCPRCGPEHGLILLAKEIVDRRVLDGEVGCSNCREHFPVTDGFADLRWPRRSEPAEGISPAPDPPLAVKVAALLGLTDGSGFILLAGRTTAAADALSTMLAGDEWIALGGHLREQVECPGISRMAASPDSLPLSTGGLRGAALDAGHAEWLPEVTRALAPGARVAVFDPPTDLSGVASALGLEVVLDAPEALVATRGPALIPLRRTPANGSFGP
jgi:hypothetical protein